MDRLMPLFPLQLVAFPGEKLNLHIFEPRYKQMINECEAHNHTFGISAHIDGKVMDIGTEMRLIEIQKRYDNGEMDIKTEGIGLFKINDFFRQAPDKLYAAGKVSLTSYTMEGDTSLRSSILEGIKELFALLKIKKDIPKDPTSFNTFEVAHHIGFTLAQEYQLLCIKEEVARQEFMIRHLQHLIPIVREMENLRKKIQMNGHFKNVIPPEL